MTLAAGPAAAAAAGRFANGGAPRGVRCEGDDAGGDRVAALAVDARRAGDRLLKLLARGGGDARVDDEGDVETVDRPGRDLRVGHDLADAELGVVLGVAVVGVAARRAGPALGVGGEVGRPARLAAGARGAAALQLLLLRGLLQRDALLGVRELVLL